MACLKCGKKTTDEQSFCPRCLEIMEQYPVKPDVHVQLPNRPTAPDVKKTTRKRRVLSYEEAMILWRKRARFLAAIALALAILLGAAVFFLLQNHVAAEDLEIGKNYTFGYPFE